MSGLRVELAITDTDTCPVAGLTADSDATVRDISWTDHSEGALEQFVVDHSAGLADQEFQQVFTYESADVYEFMRDDGACPCQQIVDAGHPIADARAENGTLVVTLHLADETALSSLLPRLRERFGDVSIRTITRVTQDADQHTDAVWIDRGQLTDRQREVLATAYDMGYFEYPRQANATDVAEALDICPSTLTEHLAAAQSKLLGDLFEQQSQQQNT